MCISMEMYPPAAIEGDLPTTIIEASKVYVLDVSVIQLVLQPNGLDTRCNECKRVNTVTLAYNGLLNNSQLRQLPRWNYEGLFFKNSGLHT